MRKVLSLASWGNSKAIRIPVDFLDYLNITKDNEKNIELIGEVQDNKIIIEKKEQKSNYLKRFENYEGSTKRETVDWGIDVGNEI